MTINEIVGQYGDFLRFLGTLPQLVEESSALAQNLARLKDEHLQAEQDLSSFTASVASQKAAIKAQADKEMAEIHDQILSLRTSLGIAQTEAQNQIDALHQHIASVAVQAAEAEAEATAHVKAMTEQVLAANKALADAKADLEAFRNKHNL